MKEGTKHRVKIGLLGIAIILGVLILVPSPLCAVPHLCPGGLVISWGFSETYINTPGFLGLIFAGTWFSGMVIGALAIYASLKPTKYELRPCPTCKEQTQQFRSKVNYKKGFKLKMSNASEWKANIISEEYTCEKCRQKIISAAN